MHHEQGSRLRHSEHWRRRRRSCRWRQYRLRDRSLSAFRQACTAAGLLSGPRHSVMLSAHSSRRLLNRCRTARQQGEGVRRCRAAFLYSGRLFRAGTLDGGRPYFQQFFGAMSDEAGLPRSGGSLVSVVSLAGDRGFEESAAAYRAALEASNNRSASNPVDPHTINCPKAKGASEVAVSGRGSQSD
jgi:hypothetical protein